jgi:uncharacterized Tic20 family protein
MITVCITILLIVSLALTIKGLLSCFGLIGDGWEGFIEGFWTAAFGLFLSICCVMAFIKLYNIHVSFG